MNMYNKPSRFTGASFKSIRIFCWIFGLVAGAFLTYSTRHYANSDAIIYMEMGEFLFKGDLRGIVNLTFSPLFAVLLGIGQLIFQTTPSNELIILSVVNFLCYGLALWSCDLMVISLGHGLNKNNDGDGLAIPWPDMALLIYGFFLIASLTLIRLRLTNPDMLILFWTCLGMALVLKIHAQNKRFLYFIALGVILAFGYMSKAVFFMFGPMLALVAGIAGGSLRSALPRIFVCLITMAVLSAPLVAALSYKKGSLTFGEGGRYIYAFEVAGQGEPIYEPEPLMEKPKVMVYSADEYGTRPKAFDVTFWGIGVKPLWRPMEHLGHALWNVWLIFEQNHWLAIILAWIVLLGLAGGFSLGGLRPLSSTLKLLAPGLWGMGLFCLIRMEPRYIAPFLFLTFAGLVTGLRYSPEKHVQKKVFKISIILVALLMAGILVQSIIDQTYSGLYQTKGKGSYKIRYEEFIAVKDLLISNGLKPGDTVAVIDNPPLYWARMAGVRVLGDVNGAEFLNTTPERRSEVIEKLKASDIKAIVAKNSQFKELTKESWLPAGTTGVYYVKFTGL